MSHAGISIPEFGLPLRGGVMRRVLSAPKLLLASIPVAALCLGIAGLAVVEQAKNRIVRADALATAQDWSAHFIQSFDGLDSLLANGGMAAGQKSFGAVPARQGQVFRFKLFDVRGRLVMASDDVAGVPADISLRDHDPDAVKVIETGREIVRLIAHSGEPGYPELLAEAYVPLLDDLGELRGIVAASMDQTATARSVSGTLPWAVAAIGGLMLLAIGIPAAAMGHRRQPVPESRHSAAIDRDRATVNATLSALGEELDAALRKLKDAEAERLRTSKPEELGPLTATATHELRKPPVAGGTSAFQPGRTLKEEGLGIELQDIALDDWIARSVEKESDGLPPAVEIECRLGLGEVALSLDPGCLNRVLISLLTNASANLAGMGGESACGPAEAPRITVSSRLTGRGVEIEVADNGPGIPSDHLGKIFEPLFMTSGDGAGFELPAAMKIMEQHGGGIDVQFHPGQGAVLVAWWPIEARMKEAS